MYIYIYYVHTYVKQPVDSYQVMATSFQNSGAFSAGNDPTARAILGALTGITVLTDTLSLIIQGWK
jgi:hypothetical protein